jgi:sialic acid synthase SpsE
MEEGIQMIFKYDKLIDIKIPEEELSELIHLEVLAKGSSNSILNTSFASNASLNRAVYWINKTDCANITAWRSGNKRAVNDANNRELQEALRAMGYGIIKLQGFYAEVGQDVSKENSFLVFDRNNDPNFYENLYNLSKQFEQDCFLYKPAEEEVAYLIGTNEEFIRDNGERIEAGRLRIGSLSAKAYSEIGSGRISFE